MGLLISCQNLTHSFGGRTLFEKISFGIEDTQKIGLIGPNGAGKSTLIKIILKLIRPDEGEITHKNGLKFGYLHQQPEFNDEISWLDNIFQELDDYSFVFEWISKLNLSEIDTSKKFSEFSGGVQKRMALARELSKNPDFLFLDEPTNHLDIDSILWLEDFLNEQNIAFLMVTHDRLFLERTCSSIYDLDKKNPKHLLVSNVSLSQHLENKDMLFEQQKATLDKRKNTLTRETEWLRRGAQARQTKQKARIMNHQKISDEVQNLKEKTSYKEVKFDFGDQRGPKKLIEIENLNFTYNERPIWKGLNLIIGSKTRLGLIGKNGSGKSTLLKLLTQNLSPSSGKIKFADNMKISYFEQNKDTLNLQLSVFKNICPQGDYVKFQGEFVYAKSYLEKFGFSYQQMDLIAEKISGGEKSRLRIAQLMLQDSQLLILDEPTNDLDLESLIALEESLDNFPGGIILVTHDRYFMDRVSNQLLFIDEAEHQTFNDYLQWENWYQQVYQNLEQNSKNEQDVKEQLNLTTPKSAQENSKKGLSSKEKREYEGLEEKIFKHEETLKEIFVLMEDPAIQAESIKISELYKKQVELEEQIKKLYERWSELEIKSVIN